MEVIVGNESSYFAVNVLKLDGWESLFFGLTRKHVGSYSKPSG